MFMTSFKAIITFLALDYIENSLVILHLVVVGLIVQKNLMNMIIKSYNN